MATLVFTAVGTAIGGPLGGALGALMGNQLDRSIAGSPKREGPRLKELAITTSSYGTAIPRHFGRMRAPGTIIWATPLKETKAKSGGSKGSPAITTYAYSASFAVALSSRPIKGVGRIWADGNLLRGAAGDMKVGGQLRIYYGHGDQEPDPLIASDKGAACPAYRGRAYCVLEELQLADFGNRIPSLTFEIRADHDPISIGQMTAGLERPVVASRTLPGLLGFSDEGGPIAGTLATIDQVYPTLFDGRSEALLIRELDDLTPDAPLLPEAAVDEDAHASGGLAGSTSRRAADRRTGSRVLRYYDVDRDYQPGLQRADGRASPGPDEVLDFPGALQASKARELCNFVAQRRRWSGEYLSWRIAEVDPALSPGAIVRVPDKAGTWRIESWEWQAKGVELDLVRLPPGPTKTSAGVPGEINVPRDMVATPTTLVAYELPWNGKGSGSERQVFAAVSSSSEGWTGAALYIVENGMLNYLQPTGRRRSCIGQLTGPLESSLSILFERDAQLEVQLVSDDLLLQEATLESLAQGSNQALVGGEILQFVDATPMGAARWLLKGLLRGRGGTEATALQGHQVGESFVLLDERPLLLEASLQGIRTAQSIAAIGLADDEPATSSIENWGASRRPLSPVHPRTEERPDGSWHLSWVRRAGGSWEWPNGEVSLNEPQERYTVGVGNFISPTELWQTVEPRLTLSSDDVSRLRAEHAGKRLWVSQIGSFASSPPLALHVII